MKKSLLILTSLLIAFFVNAQCTPNPSYTLPGIYPDSAIGLADGYVGQSYNEVITNITALDTSAVLFGITIPITIQTVELTSVTGLPSSCSYNCANSNCIFVGGSTSCVVFSSPSPNVAEIGSHQIIMNITTTIDAGIYGIQTQDDIIDYYYIDILAGAPIYGCTDPLALNYDPTATIDDSSCVYLNLSASVAWTDVTCFGSCDGTATVIVSGGCVPPSYTVLWDNGQTGQTQTNLCAGTYTYTVIDCDGTVIGGSVTISEPAPIIVSSSTTDVTCNGMCDGTATITPTGGCAPYSYLWFDGTVNPTSSGLCAGIYNYIVTDCNGCSYTGSVAITEPLPLISYDTLSVTTSIVWNGMTLTVSGDYSVTLINAAGCDSIANLNLTVTIPSGILNITDTEKSLVKITDMLGQETPYRRNTPLFYIYDDGTVEKRIVIKQ